MEQTHDILMAQTASPPAAEQPVSEQPAPTQTDQAAPAEAKPKLEETKTATGTMTVPAPRQPGGNQQAPPSFLPSPFIVLLVVMVVMFFWMHRQQRKQRDARQKLLDSIRIGDKIVTRGGIHGIVAGVKDKILVVKIADNVKVELDRNAVETVEPKIAVEEGAHRDSPAKK